MILAIAARELRSLFLSPLAWTLLAVTQFILAWSFLVQMEAFIRVQPRLAAMADAPGLTDLVVTPLFGSAATLMLLLTPLLCMRLFSEEYRSGTFSLLLSAPVSMTQIVLGKYLGVLGLLMVMLLLTAAMPLSLLTGGTLDAGKLAAGLLGLALLLGAIAAIGLYVSSLTSQPGVAALGTYGLLLFLWVINLATGSEGEGSPLFAWLSLATHFERMLSGLVRSSDLLYYLLLIAAFLILAIRRLDDHRTRS